MRKRNLVLSILLSSWLIGGLFISDFAPISYEKQVDARKRLYVNATIINKFYSEGCSKSSCYKDYYFALELADGSIVERVGVTSEFYDSQNIGDVAAFERNIADPFIIEQESTQKTLILVWMLGILGICIIWAVL